MEAAIAGLMEKQAPLFRSIATKSESLCSEASSVARAKGNALYEGAVHMRHQAAVAGGEAINRLDVLAQELMGEVKLALMRSLEPQSCPTPPPPPPPDFVLEEEQEAEAQEEEEQEQEAEPQEEEEEVEAQPHVTAPASVTVEDAEWDDCPSWIPVRPTMALSGFFMGSRLIFKMFVAAGPAHAPRTSSLSAPASSPIGQEAHSLSAAAGTPRPRGDSFPLLSTCTPPNFTARDRH